MKLVKITLGAASIIFLVAYSLNATTKGQLILQRILEGNAFDLRAQFPSESQCVLPGGWLPQGFAVEHFPGMHITVNRHYDSHDDWFVLVISDRRMTVEIVPISYADASLVNDAPICGPALTARINPRKSITFSK